MRFTAKVPITIALYEIYILQTTFYTKPKEQRPPDYYDMSYISLVMILMHLTVNADKEVLKTGNKSIAHVKMRYIRFLTLVPKCSVNRIYSKQGAFVHRKLVDLIMNNIRHSYVQFLL